MRMATIRLICIAFKFKLKAPKDGLPSFGL